LEGNRLRRSKVAPDPLGASDPAWPGANSSDVAPFAGGIGIALQWGRRILSSTRGTAMTLTAVLIDDSRTTRVALRLHLTEIGFEVVAEGDRGEHALELYERHRPTLITIDIVMPGLDGVSAARELLKRHPDANVVMCTSISARDKILACHEAGVAHYLLKPFDGAKIQTIAKAIIAKAQTGVARGA
jgi:two-component system, chemotaxis family, chemotaxis protein CheY